MGWDTISVDKIPQPMGKSFHQTLKCNASLVLDQIFADKTKCPQAVFAFWLNRDLDGNAQGGEMTLCGTDSNHYQGDIAWEPLTKEDYWRIQLGGMQVKTTQITGPMR